MPALFRIGNTQQNGNDKIIQRLCQSEPINALLQNQQYDFIRGHGNIRDQHNHRRIFRLQLRLKVILQYFHALKNQQQAVQGAYDQRFPFPRVGDQHE